MAKEEAWITSGTSNSELASATILAKSLKAVKTSRKVILITTANVMETSWKDIYDFDDTIILDDIVAEKNLMTMGLYAKIHCWTLLRYKKCVFIAANSNVLKNSDELFNLPEITVGFDKGEKINLSLFVFCPSWPKYKQLLQAHSDSLNSQEEINIITQIWGQNIHRLESTYNYGPTSYIVSVLHEQDQNSFKRLTHEQLLTMADNRDTIENEIPLPTISDESKNQHNKLAWNNTPPNQHQIAVVGIACRLPGANNLTELWELLMNESPLGIEPTKLRSSVSSCDDTKFLPMTYLSTPIDEIDNHFFGMSPVEINFMDPQTRILMELAWEALEDAGIDPSGLKGSNGSVYTGVYTEDFKGILNQGTPIAENYFRKYIGSKSGSAAKLAHMLGLTGPTYSIDVACTSSMVAVHQACQSLNLRETSLALACGANLLLQPFTEDDMGGLCSKDGRCKTFDANADGFGRAEGCGVLVLKRYSDAIKDKDRIYALIRGTAVVQDGTSSCLMTPTVHGEAMAMKLAIQNSNISASDVSYVETHGTGTAVGDPVEITAIAETYSPGRMEPLTISSVKTNIGHTESCSGIAGIIKTILCLHNEMIPIHKNLEILNPKINLQSIPAMIPFEHTPWPRIEGKPRLAGVNCFGLTGCQAHVILQEAPLICKVNPIPDIGKQPFKILSLSAKTPETLESLIKSYGNFLETSTSDWIDIVYSANTGRSQRFSHRAAIIAKSALDMKNIISMGNVIQNNVPITKPKICFLFPGLGCLYDGMACELYGTCPVFRSHFNKCNNYLLTKWDMSLKKYISGTNVMAEDKDKLLQSHYSQTFIFIVEYCLFKTWEAWGIQPDYVLGHSVGEICASVAAGMMTSQDAIDTIVERKEYMKEVSSGGMIAVKANRALVDELLIEFKIDLEIAAVNSDEQTVLAGTPEKIRLFSDICRSRQIKCSVLKTELPYHSSLMSVISEKAKQCYLKHKYSPPNCKYVSGLKGRMFKKDEQIDAAYWVQQMEDQVRFLDASLAVLAEGCTMFLEVGPMPLLSAFMTSNHNCFGREKAITCLPSIRKNGSDSLTMLTTLGNLHVNGFNINWDKLDDYSQCRKVSIPHYPFQRKQFPIIGVNTQHLPSTEIINKVHPLLGTSVNNASSTQIYQNDLSSALLEYIKDHVIANIVLFPTGGFLEMALCARQLPSKVTNLGSMTSISISDVKIVTPLCIDDTVQVQVIKCPGLQSELKIEIFSEQLCHFEGTKKWIRHITTTSSTTSVATDQEDKHLKIQITDYFGLPEINVSSFYDKISKLGFTYGDNFRSLMAVWKAEDTLLAEIQLPPDSDQYLIHPVVLDGMLQAILLNDLSEKINGLCLPSVINKCTWFRKPEGVFVYAFCYRTENVGNAALFDCKNNLLLSIEGVVFAKTSVETIQRQLNRFKPPQLPSILEIEWRPTLGHLEERIDLLTAFKSKNIFPSTFIQEITAKNASSPLDDRNLTYLNELCCLYILQAFDQIGWKSSIGQVLKVEEFCINFNIKATFMKLILRFFEILTEDEYLKLKITDTMPMLTWKVVTLPPSLNKISERIAFLTKELDTSKNPGEFCHIDAFIESGTKLSNVLLSKITEKELFFTFRTESHQSFVKLLKSNHPVYTKLNTISREGLIQALKPILDLPKSSRGIVRILEIQSGSGKAAELFLPILENLLRTSFIYTFTDSSVVNFPSMAQKFAKYSKNLKFGIFDVENDPVGQGYMPGQFDIILGLNVFNKVKNPSILLRNLRTITTKSGLLIVMEATKPLRDFDITLGLLDDYWLNNDPEFRPNHSHISIDKFKNLLLATGYDKIASIATHQDYVGVITARVDPAVSLPERYLDLNYKPRVVVIFSDEGDLSKYLKPGLESLATRVVVIEKSTTDPTKAYKYIVSPDSKAELQMALHDIQQKYGEVDKIIYLWSFNDKDRDQTSITLPLLNLAQLLSKNSFWKKLPSLIVGTQGLSPIGDYKVINPSLATKHGLLKVLQNEVPDLKCKIIDIDSPESLNYIERSYEEFFMEIWNDDKEFDVAFRNRSRYIARLVNSKKGTLMDPLQLPNSRHYTLSLPKTKVIRDLKLVSLPLVELGDNDLEVTVKATGISNDLSMIFKPCTQLNSVGQEFAGVVTRIGCNIKNYKLGDPVFGWTLQSGTYGSILTIPANRVINIPTSWTYGDAATLPIAFRTAYYCLFIVGQLKLKETVVIDTDLDGVDLCAIQLAKQSSAQIITVGGSSRKRAYLRNIGLKYAYSSETELLQYVEEVTGGKGVDVILSLTGSVFKQTILKSCASGARYIEIGKLDALNPEGVASKRTDVNHSIMDMTLLPNEVDLTLIQKLREFTDHDLIEPLPYSRFDFLSIRDALEYLKMGDHIGKVVLEMLEVNIINGTTFISSNIFNDRSTYLITGGFGGIGLKIAEWMANSGAKYIALVGRSQPNTDAQEQIKLLTERGKVIISLQADIGDINQCQQMLQELKVSNSKLPPVRGVMHAAGLLDSALIDDTTWSKFESTYKAKVDGGWNLHDLTKDTYNLQHFVLFSSVSAILGLTGLSNYAASNSFLDALAHHRHSMGLTALSINWGQWGQIGLVADMEFPGIHPLEPSGAIQALETVMKSHAVQKCVTKIDPTIIRAMYPNFDSYLEEVIGTKNIKEVKVPQQRYKIDTAEFFKEFQSSNEKINVVQKHLENILKQLLMMNPDDKIDSGEAFQNLGLDSLMFVQLRNSVDLLTQNKLEKISEIISEDQTLAGFSSKITFLLDQVCL